MKLSRIVPAVLAILLQGCTGASLGHYWDGYDFSSTEGLEPIEEARERFAGYIRLLEKTDTATAAVSIRDFLDRAKADTVSYYVYSDYFIGALYPLASRLRDPQLLSIYLREAIRDGIATEYQSFDEVELLRKCRLNLPGSIAEDGEIMLADSTVATVRGLASRTRRTLLLLIGQAGCRSCIKEMEHISENTPETVGLVAVLRTSQRGEFGWLQRNLPERWKAGLAMESFLENWDFGLAPAKYILDRDGKVKSSTTF